MKIDVAQTLEILKSFVGTVGALVAAGYAVRRWWKAWLQHELAQQLEPIKAELQPNGGKSMRDEVVAIRRSVDVSRDELRAEMDRKHRENRDEIEHLRREMHGLRRAFLQHIRMAHRGDLSAGPRDESILHVLEDNDQPRRRPDRPDR